MIPSRFIIRSTCVFTGLTAEPQPAAIAVEDSRIEAVLPWDFRSQTGASACSNSGVRRGAAADCGSEVHHGSGARYAGWPLYDYGDRLIMPSFIDAHTHLFQGAIEASDYVCSGLGDCRSEAECAAAVAAFAAAHPDYPVIRGSGWFLGAWEDPSYPTRLSLDQALGSRPAFLMNADCHSMWLNTAALEMIGLDPSYAPEGGVALHLEDGSLSGLLLEPAAYAPAEAVYSAFTPEELREIHRSFQRRLAAYGIGALSEMFADDYTDETRRRYDVVRDLDLQEGLSSHVFVYTKLFGYTEFSAFRALQEHCASPHFHIAGLKGFVDGVTETHTGMLLEPYTDMPESCGVGTLPLWPRDKMMKEVAAANADGIPVRLHCIGDGAVRLALDLYENALEKTGQKDLRNTIEHIENIHPEDIPRFARLGVVPSMQPYHLTLSNNGKVRQLGPERCRLEFPVRTMYHSCGHLAIGTDYPVVAIDPFRTIYAALTRCDDEGAPTGQNADSQTLTMTEILRAYTIEGARVYHAEDRMGTLEAGKLANLIVLDRNLFTAAPQEIPHTRVIANYFEGREIYRSEETEARRSPAVKSEAGTHTDEHLSGGGAQAPLPNAG
ncbi:MAG: amidohydrolase family protein [Eubacteriales bacterium]|nr:amidohydrolase family protein [Eubacteriales bacterium]